MLVLGPGNLLLSRLGTPLSAKHRSGSRAACTEKQVSKREVPACDCTTLQKRGNKSYEVLMKQGLVPAR